MKATRIIAKSQGRDPESFETVYLNICEANYINEWILKKAVKSTNKKYSASVLCQHGVKTMDIFIVIIDNQGIEIDKKMLISELPHEFAYAKHLGEIKWVSNNEVTLVDKEGETFLDC